MKNNALDSNKIKILVCCHKPCDLPQDDFFLPIHVGAAISDFDLGLQRDDQVNGQPCDNISKKNPNYCELTAMYWAWKNIKKIYPDLEYIGLNHYRRYFDFDKSFSLSERYIIPTKETSNYKLNKTSLISSLEKGLTIIPKRTYYPNSMGVIYCANFVSDDFFTEREIIKNIYPDYFEAYDKVMLHSNIMVPYNMFVMEWSKFDAYCNWLFSFLGDVEKKLNLENYSTQQKRIFGYIAEEIFYVWLLKNKIKTKEFRVIKYADDDVNHLGISTWLKKYVFNFMNFVLDKSGFNKEFFFLRLKD